MNRPCPTTIRLRPSVPEPQVLPGRVRASAAPMAASEAPPDVAGADGHGDALGWADVAVAAPPGASRVSAGTTRAAALAGSGTSAKRPAPSRAASVAERCDPPTYMDAAGIRHFKKGCL